MRARTLAARVISCRWPSSPNPVTSVAAETPTSVIACAAPRFSVAMMRMASWIVAADVRSCLIPVVMTPIPRGFVSTSRSPGLAAAFVTMRLGWTNPVTASPYFGSGSSMVWPPMMTTPASLHLSPPPRRISPRTSRGSFARGNPAKLSANFGVPPIA